MATGGHREPQLKRQLRPESDVLPGAGPVLSGITRFDLLGDFGRYNWLGNFYIVFLYNMLFAGLTSASLIKTVTWAVQRELIRAFGQSRFFFSFH